MLFGQDIGIDLGTATVIAYVKGKGIVLMDGQPLKSLIIPKVSKKKILSLLQK